MAFKDKGAEIKYKNAYNAEKYDMIRATPSKAEGQKIREAAARAGESVSAYILGAVRQRMEREAGD